MSNAEKSVSETSETSKSKISKAAVIKGIVAIAIAATLAGGYFYSAKRKVEAGKKQAQDKVVAFVEDNLVQPGTKVDVASVTFENGLYKVVIKVGVQEHPTYITSDGRTFFPEAIDLVQAEKDAQTQANAQTQAQDIPKSDKPQVDLYVMSFCPFGNKAEDTLKPVYDLLKNKVDFNFHYIVSVNDSVVTSLHGVKEVTEDEKEVCVLKLFGKDKWMSIVAYVNRKCGNDGSCFDAGAKTLGINTAQVNSCVASDGLILMKANEQASNDAGASGSPTMTINGVNTKAVYQYGNSEGYKKAICGAFNTAPSECSKTLSASTATAQGGSCATPQ